MVLLCLMIQLMFELLLNRDNRVKRTEHSDVGNFMLRCVSFVYVAFVSQCEAVILYLFRTLSGLIKNRTANSKAGERIGGAGR